MLPGVAFAVPLPTKARLDLALNPGFDGLGSVDATVAGVPFGPCQAEVRPADRAIGVAQIVLAVDRPVAFKPNASGDVTASGTDRVEDTDAVVMLHDQGKVAGVGTPDPL